MAKKMLINTLHPEEARVAIVDDGRLVDLDIEIAGSEQTRGNIYKGVVLRVEPGLQAAFVDIGLKKPGFLQMGELHPDWWQWRDDVPEDQRKRRPRIQEVLRRGQELLVQVEKDERDMKGAALTSYVSLPGRYMVVMPGSDSTGISRKVEADGERKKLKELVAQMTIPEGIGYIIRTEAVGKSLEELQKDLDNLVATYNELRQKGAEVKAPARVYKEYPVVIRMIRDYFTAEIDEVLIDSKEVYKEAKDFFKEAMPQYEKLVKMHTEKRPIFSRYQIEEQIDQIYEKKVLLKSGGSLVIEPTEALVSIDVNSGKSTGEKGVEDTAFRTNMEAAEEAARQLRLRDLGGLIVIDFIDMRDSKRIKEVEKTLKQALKSDKARVTVGRISQFGILEMSRQRIKQTLEQASILDCPHCSGRGKVKSVESMAISFLRKVHGAAAKGTGAEVRGSLPLEVAYYLLNRKKRDLAQIENDYDVEVTIKGKPSFLMNQLELEVIKRERPLFEAPAEEKPARPAAVRSEPRAVEEAARQPAPPAPEAAATAEAGEEPAGKKKRTRSRKKPKEEAPAEPTATEEAAAPAEAVEAAATEPSELPAVEGQPAGEGAEEPKKKRRRRRRRKGKSTEAATTEAQEEEQAESAEAEEEAAEPAEEPTAEAGAAEQHEEPKKKKRRRRRKGGAKATGAEEEEAAETVAEPEPALTEPEPVAVIEPEPVAVIEPVAEPVVESVEAPPEKKKRSRPTRKKEPVVATVEAEPVAVVAPVEAQPEAVPEPAEKPARPKRSRAKKAVVEQPAAEPETVQAVEPAPAIEPVAAEKPKAKRAPRKKKAATAAGENEGES